MQLWLADRNPSFDGPEIYRRPAQAAPKSVSGWDGALLAMVALVLIGAGTAGLLLTLALLTTIVMTWFS